MQERDTHKEMHQRNLVRLPLSPRRLKQMLFSSSHTFLQVDSQILLVDRVHPLQEIDILGCVECFNLLCRRPMRFLATWSQEQQEQQQMRMSNRQSVLRTSCAPSAKRRQRTYKDIHFAVQIVVHDQVVCQFETMRLHRMARTVVEMTFISCA